MTDALRRQRPVELSTDARFAGRVRRLAATASVALGLIWALALVTVEAPIIVHAALAAGWLLMPVLLVASLGRPLLRYALVVPATLVGLGLLAMSFAWRPESILAAAGWPLMAVGVLLGGWMGLWFWYRLVPVPAVLDDPFSPGRLVLIRIHVGLIIGGWLLAATALLPV